MYIVANVGGNQGGVLGLTFKPDQNAQLIVRVRANNQFQNDIYPHVGLSADLANIVLTHAIDLLTNENTLGSGVLDFDCALWDEANSSPYLFKWLTRSLIKMLELGKEEFTSETVTNIVESMKQM